MLQCLLATEALSTYFRNFAWKNEINENNPLGMGGKVAQEFAGLNDAVSHTPLCIVVLIHTRNAVLYTGCVHCCALPSTINRVNYCQRIINHKSNLGRLRIHSLLILRL